MSSSRIAISGASSFTATWIAKHFSSQAWDVHTLYRKQLEEYQRMRATRSHLLSTLSNQHFGISAEDGSMAQILSQIKPDIWIHHHHWMVDFKSAQYDAARAVQNGCAPLEKICTVLKANHCKGVIHSATYFEQSNSEFLSPQILNYTETKKTVRSHLTKLCKQLELPLSVIYIPNPVGPLEDEDRLIPKMIEAARFGKSLQLHEPHLKTKVYPVLALSSDYFQTSLELLKGNSQELTPEGVQCTINDWVQVINRELIGREFKWPSNSAHLAHVPLELNRQFSQSIWDGVWKHYAEWFEKYA